MYKAVRAACIALAAAACGGSQYALTLQKAGTGNGLIQAGGLECAGNVCAGKYGEDDEIALTATADSSSSFARWEGCDRVAGNTCYVKLASERTVVATFNGPAVTMISADITQATTWIADMAYEVTKPIVVSAPLTILPGTVVRFDPGASMLAKAPIVADGSAEGRGIFFTSARQGGRLAGDWEGITLQAGGSIFRYAEFSYASTALRIEGVAASVLDSKFYENSLMAIDASTATAATMIARNELGGPMAISSAFSLDENSFENSSETGAVYVAGTHVTSALTWAPQAHAPYVLGSLVVDSGASLTLDGVVLKFAGGALDVRGTIDAKNTVFTSLHDDRYLGDTDRDGIVSPASGDWAGVRLFHSGSSFDRCAFSFAGAGALQLDTSVTKVTNSTFYANRDAVETLRTQAALDASHAPVGTVIMGNTFIENSVPLAIHPGLSLDDSNFFSAIDWQYTPSNVFQAVRVTGCAAVTSPARWTQTKVPFVMGDPGTSCSWVDIQSTLDVGPGVVLKFVQNGALYVQLSGSLRVGDGALMTSLHDDVMVDVDHENVAPRSGDWLGIKYTVLNHAPICGGMSYMRYFTVGCDW